jgi:hypothetical protein
MERNETTKTPEYSAPEIVDHGSLTELTASLGTGTHLDHFFPTGTKKSDLTFSGP